MGGGDGDLINCYEIKQIDDVRLESGRARLAIGFLHFVPGLGDFQDVGRHGARLAMKLQLEAIGKDHRFKTEIDEETKRAMFPSNYPEIAM